MTVTLSKPVIIDPERQVRRNVSKPAHFIIEVGFKDLHADHKNTFLIVPIQTLTKHMPHILEQFKRLRAIFVLKNEDAKTVDALFDMIVQRKAERILPKLVVARSFAEIDKVLHAWCDNVQDSTIAQAWIDQDDLVLKTCALDHLVAPFNKMPQLSSIPKAERGKFEIDPYGRYLFWKDYDVHLNVDAVRYVVDDKFRIKRDIELLTRNREYGRAISLFREQKGLSQQDISRISGISDRQLRRIEREGHSLSVDMLSRLAKAHGLTPNRYLNALSSLLREARAIS